MEWQQLTDNRVLGLSKEDMVEPDVVSYPSFDGMEIEALLFKAKPENDNGYTIFWPHGGPQAAERKYSVRCFNVFLTVATLFLHRTSVEVLAMVQLL